ncbi:Fic family protein [Flavobacterium muglaense]|uniref:Fic family protein n=1 Tax=Flavobacterium muglaense TaxID=2764716 RepID=A0A923MZJ2_9FLAO|nr:Fic family protein [Flavobacterium muglaense]MBC5837810.1 Fic family protein [Flavobacterium muglaense]MBC5844432.1 Fic family protein [Flavobacterium muglaense]
MNSVNISITSSVFQEKTMPITGKIVGYTALISYYELDMPYPDIFVLVSNNNKKKNSEGWKVFPAIYQPEETPYKQILFALKHEGVSLLFFKRLFQKIEQKTIIDWIINEPTSIYVRKIWFLYEFLMQSNLPLNDANTKIKYTPLLDEKIQFGITTSIKSGRHRIINNLPGTVDFCPLIFKTEKLEAKIKATISAKTKGYLSNIHKDVLQRASSFLLLKDSKASFTIENENPGNTRAMRWGKAIGQAGGKQLSIEELIRLQQIVIENSRFMEMGLRKEGGFIGEHDRITGEPIPDHISANAKDLEKLVSGLLAGNILMQDPAYDAVLAAATIAFGFVFIHPFVDGNGRLHRYIIHHILATKEFTKQGVIFPISASILDHIEDYRKTLELYSHPLLNHIQWKETQDHNVQVLNDTIDFYRYFDATKQAEFLYDCVEDTIERIIPQEVIYLQKYDVFKKHLDNIYEMPDNIVALLVRFLEQNEGKLSKRALKKEFSVLTATEIKDIEDNYNEIFNSNTVE